MLGKEWPCSSAGALILFCVTRNNCSKRKCRATVCSRAKLVNCLELRRAKLKCAHERTRNSEYTQHNWNSKLNFVGSRAYFAEVRHWKNFVRSILSFSPVVNEVYLRRLSSSAKSYFSLVNLCLWNNSKNQLQFFELFYQVNSYQTQIFAGSNDFKPYG